MCHLLLTLKIIRKRAQICDRCSLEYFAMLSRFHSRGPTHDFGSVTRIAFKYKLPGFRINFFQKWFLCPLFCVCFFHNSRSKHSRKPTSCTSITSVRLRRIIAFNFDCRVHLFVQLSIFLCLKFSIESVVVFKRSSCRFKAILSQKLPKTVLCVPQSG